MSERYTYQRYVYWTKERTETLSKLWLAGHSITQIANALGASRNSVSGKIARMNLRRKNITTAGAHNG